MALAVLPPIGAIVFRLLGATLRFEDIGAPGTHADDHPETRVYCLWHRSLLSIAHHFRKRKIAILISPSFDGELIAAMIHRVGYTPVRGSSSRGGAVGLLGMQRALDGANGARCNYAAFTSDGPRGPGLLCEAGRGEAGGAGGRRGRHLLCGAGSGVGAAVVGPVFDSETVFDDCDWVAAAGSGSDAGPRTAADEEESDGKAWEPARLAVEQALERARHEVEEHIARKRGKAS